MNQLVLIKIHNSYKKVARDKGVKKENASKASERSERKLIRTRQAAEGFLMDSILQTHLNEYKFSLINYRQKSKDSPSLEWQANE